MPDPDAFRTPPDVPTCAVPRAERADAIGADGAGLLGGGCCSDDDRSASSDVLMGRNARRARAIAGAGFLAIAGALSSRRLPGRVALWPAALVPTWFGISHLVAGVTGYEGCPELGAIPSVMLNRPVRTRCEHWQRIDRHIDTR